MSPHLRDSLAVFLILGVALLMIDVASAQPDTTSPAASLPSLQATDSKARLEGEKLALEIQKLETENKFGLIPPLVSMISIVGLVIGLLVQRKTALNVQERAEQVNFEMKTAELVMGAYSPGAAKDRVLLLERLYPNRLSPQFVKNFDPHLFHGTRLYDLKMNLFKELVGKVPEPEDVTTAFAVIFFEDEQRWREEFLDRLEEKFSGKLSPPK
jgi:hypothetical protein